MNCLKKIKIIFQKVAYFNAIFFILGGISERVYFSNTGGINMGSRRMFSLSVVDTDKFIDMPITARLLYYELGMRADDDGFISSAKKIVRMVGCSEDDLKLLIAKDYIICFESGIVVIKHWKMHNYIPKDRYHKTIFQEEYSKLQQENDVYTFSDTPCIQDVYNTDTSCIQNDNKMYPEVKLSKGKIRKEKLI